MSPATTLDVKTVISFPSLITVHVEGINSLSVLASFSDWSWSKDFLLFTTMIQTRKRASRI